MHLFRRAALAALAVTLLLLPFVPSPDVTAQEATPAVTSSCESAAAASPMANMGGLVIGTPAAGAHDVTGENVEFDQRYIDMMVPHHTSIIALAQAAQDRLTDERLKAMAANIIRDQQLEIEELRGYRDLFYGDPRPLPMDEHMMTVMMQLMPGTGDMTAMQLLMDPQALVAAFCGAADPDLAFIDLTIPHHEMAVQASKAALDHATHEEIRMIAQRVIEAQQHEIDELQSIRVELTGGATPVNS